MSCDSCLEASPQRPRRGGCRIWTQSGGLRSRSRNRLPLLPASDHPEPTKNPAVSGSFWFEQNDIHIRVFACSTGAHICQLIYIIQQLNIDFNWCFVMLAVSATIVALQLCLLSSFGEYFRHCVWLERMAPDWLQTSSSTFEMCRTAARTSASTSECREGSLCKCAVQRSLPVGWNSERWIPPATSPFWSHLRPFLCLMGTGSCQALSLLTLNSYPMETVSNLLCWRCDRPRSRRWWKGPPPLTRWRNIWPWARWRWIWFLWSGFLCRYCFLCNNPGPGDTP